MTVVKNNMITQGLSGMIGDQVVFRQRHGLTIVSKKPRRSAGFSPAQLAHQHRFQAATEWAHYALANPGLREMYGKAGGHGRTAYNMAISDALNPPVVDNIDIQGYVSGTGSPLTVWVRNRFRTKSVTVRITRPDGILVEEGEAMQEMPGPVWTYAVTVANPSPAGCRIAARAADFPGNTAELTVTVEGSLPIL
ncbi:MAG TPA: hypothetical protein PKG48_12970 [Bacteroidales bacterium]|nr:hypothetical protein [Bacteroidales bacterium]